MLRAANSSSSAQLSVSNLTQPRSLTHVTTRFSESAGLSAPKMSFEVALTNEGKPAIGRYSWSSVSSAARICLACADDRRTVLDSAHGLRDFQSARVRSREIPSHEGSIDLQRGRPQRFPDPHAALRAHLADDGQDKGLAVIVAVRSDAEVDFFVKRVLLVAGRQRKDGVGRGERS